MKHHRFGHGHADRRKRTAIGFAPQRSARSARVRIHPRRFVTQRHALGLPRVRTGTLVIVGLAALALYLIGERLSR